MEGGDLCVLDVNLVQFLWSKIYDFVCEFNPLFALFLRFCVVIFELIYASESSVRMLLVFWICAVQFCSWFSLPPLDLPHFVFTAKLCGSLSRSVF
jgi:hypothetical protein